MSSNPNGASPPEPTAGEGGDATIKKAVIEAQTSALQKLKEKAKKIVQAGNALTDRLGVAAVSQHVPAFMQEKFNTALSALVHTTASITLANGMEKCNLKVLRENVDLHRALSSPWWWRWQRLRWSFAPQVRL